MIYGHFSRKFKNRRHFAIWLHASQRQRRVWSTPGHIKSNFRIHILNKKWVFLGVWSQESKTVIFIFVRCLEMLKIAVWKYAVINEYGLWAICSSNIHRCMKLKFGMSDVQVRFYDMLYLLFWKFGNFGFWNRYIYIYIYIYSTCLLFGYKISFLENLR